jgi:hypothetical protein
MHGIALFLWLQDHPTDLMSNESKLVMWVVTGLVAIIGSMLAFGGKHLFDLMHEDRRERQAVMEKVQKVADDHSVNNLRIADTLGLMGGRLLRVETIIQERLPPRPRRRAAL